MIWSRPGSGEKHVRWLLLRCRGSLWAVQRATLVELAGGPTPQLELKDGTTLEADEFLQLTSGLAASPFPRCAERFYPAKIHGLAVWRRQPVVLLEPGALPPACLTSDSVTEMEAHGDETR